MPPIFKKSLNAPTSAPILRWNMADYKGRENTVQDESVLIINGIILQWRQKSPLLGGLILLKWWRRGELNPRPRALYR